MNGFAFRKHMVFDWSGARYRMERLQPNGEILVERVAGWERTVAREHAARILDILLKN